MYTKGDISQTSRSCKNLLMGDFNRNFPFRSTILKLLYNIVTDFPKGNGQ